MVKVDENWLQPNGLYKCPECGVEKTKKGIGGHIWIKHGEGKNHKPFDDFIKENGSWNKGLDKNSDERILKSSQSCSKSQKGKKGRKHYEETKIKISKARLKFLIANPDKVPYKLNHSSKESYPEKIFREALEKHEIKGWVQEYSNGIYRYDFAFPELKIDIEIDGATHKEEKVKLIDARRDEWSKSEGWIVLRFDALTVKKDVLNCINKTLQFINGEQISCI